MKIIFFGSDDFAVTNLRALRENGQKVCACVTAPDKPKGRGMHVAASPVKEFATHGHIPVLQPTDLKDEKFINKLMSYDADLFVVIAYGKILPPDVLSVPKICAINCHASLLPKYRGAAPINWAIINGDEETGITIIRLNPQMDAGDIIAQAKTRIESHDNAVSLRIRLAQLSEGTLLKTIKVLATGTLTSTVQKKSDVTFAPKLKKEIGAIDWQKSADEIHNLVRGLIPWPTAYSYLNGKMIKLLDSEAVSLAVPGQPGEIVQISPQGMTVVCGIKGLLITQVHPESGRSMTAADFVHGHKVGVGQKLDSRHS